MSLTIRNNYFSPGFLHNVQNAQHATRGTGANVHDSLRSVLYHLRVQHGFTLEDFALLHAAPDSPTRRSDLTPGEVERLIEGMFEDGFGAEVQRRSEATGRGIAPAPRNPSPTLVTELDIRQWRDNAAKACTGKHAAKEGEPIALSDFAEGSEPIPDKGYQQFLAAVETLFDKSETISLVTACTPEGSPIANDKPMYPDGWRRLLTRPNSISGKAGVWWRHNPVKLKGGSGKNGAVKDEDILTRKYLLLENDVLPMHLQAGILRKLIADGLPIRCVTDSGGKSLHALLEIRPEHYDHQAPRILAWLHNRFGFDKGNTNASRMSRAPGFVRGIGARKGEDGRQRLLFLARPSGQGFPLTGGEVVP